MNTQLKDGFGSNIYPVIKGLGGNDLLTVVTYNIGHFSQGVSPSSTIIASNYASKLASFRNLIYGFKADIIGLTEYSSIFGKNVSSVDVNASDVLFLEYPNVNEGQQIRYSCNAIYAKTKYALSNVTKINFDAFSSLTTLVNGVSGADYYYYYGIFNFRGIDILFCEVHFPPYRCYTDSIGFTDGLQELVNRFSSYEHVIIAGDFNWRWTWDGWGVITNAGYTAANPGTFITYPETLSTIDNIFVKGFTVNDVAIIENSLSDHYPLIASLDISF